MLTESLFDYKLQQYPEGVGDYEDFIRENWLGRRTADCIGLLKGYAWLDTTDMTIGYAENGAPDYGANQMYQYVKERGEAGEDYGGMASRRRSGPDALERGARRRLYRRRLRD